MECVTVDKKGQLQFFYFFVNSTMCHGITMPLKKKKESSSVHSTVLTGFSKPSFVLKSYDFQENSSKIL